MKNKNTIYNLILIGIGFLITVIVYNKLPNQIPTHWNISGEIDKYSSKLFGSFLLPSIMLLVWIGMLLTPKIDPKKNNYSKFDKSYNVIINVTLTFLFILHICVLGVSLDYNIEINRVIPFMLGILLIVIGNYLPKSKTNFFYGIKTPWTLTNEDTWKKTHRLGGKLFVLSGLVIIISSLFFTRNLQFTVVIISILVAGIIPIIASYFYSKNNI
ncbi:SdpI family protein [Clostridium weizhouense]|uniref:SdpI family protein n=1 Tax=Clostridium weizhouense TaxID=2859781 RepID=A0ABS7AQI2_9CLOT|nr:SdpI family protein [Clostridium weizhouense]MBW6410651.1 SdpI family protein [Clostridium weizhouense]